MFRSLNSFAVASFVCLSLLRSPIASAAGSESDVFARILARLASERSTTVVRYLAQRSPELRELSRAILGAEANGVAEENLAETAIRRLKHEGNYRLARNLEERLESVERDFVTEMERDPNADMDALLGRLSSERLRTRGLADGQYEISFRGEVPPSASERALSDALGADPELTVLRERVKAASAQLPELKLEQALETHDTLLKEHAEFAKYLPKTKVYATLGDEEMIEFSANLSTVMATAQKLPASMSPAQRMRWALRKTLSGKVPARTIAERIGAFMSGEAHSFERAMGDMTLAETQELFHGGDPLHPTPDSLLGQYLKETGATTLVRTFDDAAAQEAGKAGAQGPQKLVVSLSEKSMPVFLKYFKRKEWMSVFGHAYMVHDGQTITYGRQFSDFRSPGTEYTPFPMVLLKPTEGQRAAQYFRLFRQERATFSYDSKGSGPWNIPGYCAKSSWAGGCTQHIGNIPIGDERVVEYFMPGNGPGRDALNPAPNVQRLKPYAGESDLLHRVWKVPGNMQLGEVIGQQAASLRGELANPGWVIWTFLGPTSVDRVPIVFVIRADHTLPIAEGFHPHVENKF